MERKATFAIKNSTPHSSAHNSRRSIPKYLIETDPYFEKNHYECMNYYESDKQFRTLAQSIYKAKIKQKMQYKQIKTLIKETVVTAKVEHTAEDIKKLFDALRDKMGGGYHLLELSGHFDEGHFERIEDGWENLTYYPSSDILLKEDGNWYIKKDELNERCEKEDFIVKADMSHYKKVHNIHWHCKFTHMDLKTGKSARFKKSQVSGEGRLKFVAEFMGLRYEPKEKISRGQAVGSVKDQHHKRRQEKYKKIIEKKRIIHDKNLKLKESELMLRASRANHKTDSDHTFEMYVENRGLKADIKNFYEYAEDIEGQLLEYKLAYEKLLAEMQQNKSEPNDSSDKIIKEEHTESDVTIPSILNSNKM